LFYSSDSKVEALSSVQANILSQARQHRRWHEETRKTHEKISRIYCEEKSNEPKIQETDELIQAHLHSTQKGIDNYTKHIFILFIQMLTSISEPVHYICVSK
jgi:hypothetical protein